MESSTDIKLEGPSTKERDILSFPQAFSPGFLCRAQNADGGWGYRPGLHSSTEPTAWSILALRTHEAAAGKVLSSASDWLQRAQLKEGAWPTDAAEYPGCWTTALACLALLKPGIPLDDSVSRGLQWLCETRPAEGNSLWRLRQRWLGKSETVVSQNHSLFGWSWTPNTASWVEPTAYALILLQNLPRESYPPRAAERLQRGEKMLYDRVCPGGGWNAGNPLVYGVPGVPRIGPTVWALLALRRYKDRAANMESLDWLERNYNSVHSPSSLALAQLCLKVYGRPIATIEPELHKLYHHNQFLQNIPVMGWALMALDGIPDWLECPLQGEDENKV